MPLLTAGKINTICSEDTSDFFTNKVLQQYTADNLVLQIENFPPMPAIGMEILRLTENPNSHLSNLEKILSRDPVLTSRVFKMANSSFFSRGIQSSTISSACARLGMNTIRNLVMACCVGQILSSDRSNYAYQPNGIWLHSLQTALSGQTISGALGYSHEFQAELFLAGLLHDIGKLVLDPIINVKIDGWGSTGLHMEQETLGVTHTEVGEALMKQWKLPDYCQSVVAHHHTLNSLTSFECHVALIHITDWILNMEGIALENHSRSNDMIDPIAMEILAIKENDLIEIRSDFLLQLETCGVSILDLH